MQISKAKVNPRFQKQAARFLYQVMADIRCPQEVKEFLACFLTKNELEMFTRRLGIAYLLNQNRTYADIKENLAVSSATVSLIAEQTRRQKKGIQIALEKIKAEEWATRWSKKFSMMVKKRRR